MSAVWGESALLMSTIWKEGGGGAGGSVTAALAVPVQPPKYFVA